MLYRTSAWLTLLHSSLLDSEKNNIVMKIGHLHDDVILLLRPESFSFFLSYFNLVIPVRFR